MYLSWMNVKIRFKGSYLGLLWTVLEPLVMFSILFIVFSNIRDVPREDFAIYLIVGVYFYHLFSRGTSSGLASVVQNSDVIKSLNINREIFPVIAVGTTCIFVLVELIVLFGLMPVFDFVPIWTIIALPALLILFVILILGISYLLSIVYIYVKDIQPFWNIIVYGLLFISPIFWFTSEASGILLDIQKFNVLGQIIEIGHKIIVFGEFPTVGEWMYTASIIFGIFFVGYALFKKFEDRIAEKI